MIDIKYTFSVGETATQTANQTSLHLSIKLSLIDNYLDTVVLGTNEIVCRFSQPITDSELTELQGIISAHDGHMASTDEYSVAQREIIIREMTEMALIHPLLSDDANRKLTVEYLTVIDNYLNSWKRSGETVVVVEKISADAADTNNPHYGYLNTISNPLENRKVYEFLIGSILAGSTL